jgi:Concanavalin A-like lectin/glucanases superfamily
LNSSEYGLIGQCESPLDPSMCLHLIIRCQKLHLGVFDDDLDGNISLTSLKWQHVAFVFNHDSRQQLTYVDGVLDNSRIAIRQYGGRSGNLTIGYSIFGRSICYFNGFIDQLYYTNRVKTPAEILDDATLTLHFSFDNGSAYDSGSLRINGSLVGSTSKVTGRVGDAIQFGSTIPSYLVVSGLVLLGTSNQSYSMSIWIKPAVIRTSSIIHVSSQNDGFGWCIGMLGLDVTGRLIAFSYGGGAVSAFGPVLPAHSWTHAVVTYSISNGLRLYVNGTLYGSSTAFAYVASGSPNYLFLSSCLSGGVCIGMEGQFEGVLDEFRLYSRELTAYDICILSHP